MERKTRISDRGHLMKRSSSAAWILCLALAGAGADPAPASAENGNMQCAPAHLKQLTREAHTKEQYNALANCYEKVERGYLDQAARERQEWARRSRNVTAVAAKYPRPVDAARDLYEYYLSKASEAEKLSYKYSQLATQ